MEELENSENQQYVDPNEIKRPTTFLKWIENFWYHYKWHTIIGAFFLIVAIVLTVQILDKEKYDISVIYSGPVQLDGGQLEKMSEAFSELMTEDSNGDGKMNAVTYGEYLLSPEQQKKLEQEAHDKSVETNESWVFIYTSEQRSTALSSVNMLVTTGEAVICLMDKYNYDILLENGAFATLEDVLGYKPENARDDYSVYLKETDFGKYFKTAFEPLPEDTILCIRKKATVGVSRDFDDVYEANIDIYRKVLEFEMP